MISISLWKNPSLKWLLLYFVEKPFHLDKVPKKIDDLFLHQVIWHFSCRKSDKGKKCSKFYWWMIFASQTNFFWFFVREIFLCKSVWTHSIKSTLKNQEEFSKCYRWKSLFISASVLLWIQNSCQAIMSLLKIAQSHFKSL